MLPFNLYRQHEEQLAKLGEIPIHATGRLPGNSTATFLCQYFPSDYLRIDSPEDPAFWINVDCGKLRDKLVGEDMMILEKRLREASSQLEKQVQLNMDMENDIVKLKDEVMEVRRTKCLDCGKAMELNDLAYCHQCFIMKTSHDFDSDPEATRDGFITPPHSPKTITECPPAPKPAFKRNMDETNCMDYLQKQNKRYKSIIDEQRQQLDEYQDELDRAYDRCVYLEIKLIERCGTMAPEERERRIRNITMFYKSNTLESLIGGRDRYRSDDEEDPEEEDGSGGYSSDSDFEDDGDIEGLDVEIPPEKVEPCKCRRNAGYTFGTCSHNRYACGI
jgi:hypothetical protein